MLQLTPFPKPSRILVTGGAGFIGSHLVERLLADGHQVTVIDDCSTGALENLASCQNDARLDLRVGRVSVCSELSEVLRRVDFVFHLAAAVGVELVVTSPIRTIQTNLRETEVLLEAASESGTPVLLASTSEVYGKSAKPVFQESDDLIIGPPTLGRWSYACSKLMDEFLAMAYFKERQLPVVIVRLFNTVGPRQTGRYGMVLPRFIESAKAHQPLRVYGDGRQSRCFCYVKDTVESLVRLAGCHQARGQVFNVGATEEIQIGELARLVIDVLRSRSPIQLVPYAEAYAPGFEDMQRRKPDVGKLQACIGFKPATRLRDIIGLTS